MHMSIREQQLSHNGIVWHTTTKLWKGLHTTQAKKWFVLKNFNWLNIMLTILPAFSHFERIFWRGSNTWRLEQEHYANGHHLSRVLLYKRLRATVLIILFFLKNVYLYLKASPQWTNTRISQERSLSVTSGCVRALRQGN